MERYLLILLLPLAFIGCTPYRTHWQVLKGNYDYMNGRYQAATVAYLGILEKSDQKQQVIHYDLGNVFYALGETKAAEEEWASALESPEKELRFRTLFNQGNLYYELSQYSLAYSSFRRALVLKPDSVDAKMNLELALQKLSSQESQSSAAAQGRTAVKESSDEDVERILQYIKRKEESQWVSQQSGEQDADGPYW